jgi:hypothetical protein
MNDGHIMGRQMRRAAERLARKKRPVEALDREELIRRSAVLADADGSISGVTIITPDGHVEHLDARILRRGGRA